MDINLTLVLIIGVALSGCTVSNAAMSKSSPWSKVDLGTDANPLPATWMQNVLSTSGNYGEAWDNSFCDGSYDGTSGSAAMTGCVLSRVGTANALVSEGGLQFAPPMR